MGRYAGHQRTSGAQCSAPDPACAVEPTQPHVHRLQTGTFRYEQCDKVLRATPLQEFDTGWMETEHHVGVLLLLPTPPRVQQERLVSSSSAVHCTGTNNSLNAAIPRVVQ